jgi:hypothetical protein
MVGPDKPQMTIWRMRFVCWITKATGTHPEYVILLFHGINGYAKAPQYHVIRRLPVIFTFQWVPRTRFPDLKPPGRKADHSPPTSVKVKNE